MSETETVRGTLEEVIIPEDSTLEEVCESICKENGIKHYMYFAMIGMSNCAMNCMKSICSQIRFYIRLSNKKIF